MTLDNASEELLLSFDRPDFLGLLKDLVEFCVKEAEKGGVDDVIVMGEARKNNQVRFTGNSVNIVKNCMV